MLLVRFPDQSARTGYRKQIIVRVYVFVFVSTCIDIIYRYIKDELWRSHAYAPDRDASIIRAIDLSSLQNCHRASGYALRPSSRSCAKRFGCYSVLGATMRPRAFRNHTRYDAVLVLLTSRW